MVCEPNNSLSTLHNIAFSSFTNEGCPVVANNLYHVLSSGVILLGFLFTEISSTGIKHVLLFTFPVVNAVNPAKAPWIAF